MKTRRHSKASVPNQASRGRRALGERLVLGILLTLGFLYWQKEKMVLQTTVENAPKGVLFANEQRGKDRPEEEAIEKRDTKVEKTATLGPFPSIPFYIQAPTGNWANSVFQNACEEVSILMVVDALQNRARPSQEQEKEIQKIAQWQKERFGTSVDTNAADTHETLVGYMDIGTSKVIDDITEDSLVQMLAENKVVLLPTNGQKLQNPYFRPPGPKTHMVVVYGYEAKTDTFVVHDPGTKNGKRYPYKASVLLAAAGDYPTGNHLPVASILPKRGIAVWAE
jgi:hypothetical protein